MREPNIAVIAGATGLVGSYLTRILIEDAFFDRVYVLSRRRVEMMHPKLWVLPADFSSVPEGTTHVFCCLGTTIKTAGSQAAFREVDYEYPLALAKAAAAAGVKRYLVVSSVGAGVQASSFYLRVKGELEQGLRTLPFEALHIFQPSLLLGPRQEVRPGERWAAGFMRAFEWAMAGPLRKYRACPAPLLARAMAVSAERGPAGAHVFEYDEISNWGR